MVKDQKINKFFLVIIFFICFGFFLPFLVNPSFLTSRDNDLGRTYIPVFIFFRESILTYKQLPLWNPGQMMGETFIGNPLSSLFYPVNIIFLILPIKLASIVYFMIHFFLAAIFTFYLAKSFNFSKHSSLAAAIFYAFSTKMIVHLEAGHITMIAAFSLFPLAFLSIRRLLHSITYDNFTWIIITAAAITFMYFTYPTICYYAVIFLVIYWLYEILPKFKSNHFLINLGKIWSPLILLLIIGGGLSAIILVPQLEFGPLSTRNSMSLDDVALPLWNKKRFLESLIFPYLNLKNFDHESFLYLGIVPNVLFLLGFLKLSISKKIIIAIFGFISILFILGRSTSVFEIAYNYLPLLKYSRITTRIWFLVALVVALTSAYYLNRIKNSKIVYFLIVIFLAESVFLFYKRIENIPFLSFTNESLYQYLAADRDFFRVYCTSFCFNPQLLTKYNIQIL